MNKKDILFFNKKLKYTFHKSTPTTQFVQRVQLSSEETVQSTWRATISTILHNATAQYFPVATHTADTKQFKFQESFICSRYTGACVVKNMLAMYLKYHKAGLTPTTPVTSIAISPVKMSIWRKSLTNLRSEMIFLQGKPVF